MSDKDRLAYSVSLSRRAALKAGGAGAITGTLPFLSGCYRLDESSFNDFGGGNTDLVADPPQAPSLNPTILKFGLSVPLTGAFADEGRDQKRGFELAIQHLNGEGDGGMLTTMQPSSLQGNGVLGQAVEQIVVDSENNYGVVDRSSRQLLGQDAVSVIIGGSSNGDAVIFNSICEQYGASFLSAMSHEISVTGRFRSPHSFRHYLNTWSSSLALIEAMSRDIGSDRAVYFLVSNDSWGNETATALQQATEFLGWRTVTVQSSEPGAGDFTNPLNGFIDSGADVLLLVHFGIDMVNVLGQARQAGIPDLQVNGKNVVVGVPEYTTLMAEAAGNGCKGVYGCMNWHWSLSDDASVIFTQSYESAYGVKPSEAAHTVYAQTLQYADAAERAGSLRPTDIHTEMEGHVFSGLGNGLSEYRQSDHQCFKDMLVVAGRSSPSTQSDLLEIKHIVSRADVEYADTDSLMIGAP